MNLHIREIKTNTGYKYRITHIDSGTAIIVAKNIELINVLKQLKEQEETNNVS
jgi:hypothetical protein